MSDFKDFLATLKNEIGEFADYSWKDHKKAAIKDGEAFLKTAKADLQRWTALLADRQLTRPDFEWLIASKRDAAEMLALKRAGLSKVALDRFSNGLVDVIVSTAFKTFV